MTTTVIGTCGNCGGPVEVPRMWHGIYPPTPKCRSCHATPREAHGPTIPMNPPPVVERIDHKGHPLFASVEHRTDGSHWRYS